MSFRGSSVYFIKKQVMFGILEYLNISYDNLTKTLIEITDKLRK